VGISIRADYFCTGGDITYHSYADRLTLGIAQGIGSDWSRFAFLFLLEKAASWDYRLTGTSPVIREEGEL
jgi:hypothetical protein